MLNAFVNTEEYSESVRHHAPSEHNGVVQILVSVPVDYPEQGRSRHELPRRRNLEVFYARQELLFQFGGNLALEIKINLRDKGEIQVRATHRAIHIPDFNQALAALEANEVLARRAHGLHA